jgi:hypothetical protein
MADEEEERGLENQLELQFLEQKDSLAALNDALASDPSNPELLSVTFSAFSSWFLIFPSVFIIFLLFSW